MSDDKPNARNGLPAETKAPAEHARRLVRAVGRAALSTLEAESGWPYGSLVTLAFDHDATPLLLLSDLSRHARNLAADDRASLLIDATNLADPPPEDPLTGPRVTLLGRIRRDDAATSRARFLARHPAAGLYAGFADFHVCRLMPERIHFVAGFGQVRWFDAGDFLSPPPPGFAVLESRLLARLQADPALAERLAAAAGSFKKHHEISGIDPDGLDFRLAGAFVRHDFARPLDAAEIVQALGLDTL